MGNGNAKRMTEKEMRRRNFFGPRPADLGDLSRRENERVKRRTEKAATIKAIPKKISCTIGTNQSIKPTLKNDMEDVRCILVCCSNLQRKPEHDFLDGTYSGSAEEEGAEEQQTIINVEKEEEEEARKKPIIIN